MDGVLLEPLESVSTAANLAPLVTRLLAEVDQLRAEVVGLRRENLELRQQAGYWRSRHADAVRRIAALEQENELLRGEIRKLQAERFGRRSEKQSRRDRSNELADPADAEPKRPRGDKPVSQRQSAAIIAICPFVSSSSIHRKWNRSARIVACR
jgi:chromosome segregation ATPase